MCGVVGNERKIKRVWDTSQQAIFNRYAARQTVKLRKGYSFPMLAVDYEQEQEELREKLLQLNEEINEQEE